MRYSAPQGSALPAAAMEPGPLVAIVARGTVSPNAVVGVLSAPIAALLAAMMGLLIWQFGLLGDSLDSLSTRIDNQDARIDSLGSELRGEIGMLRTEMRAGFRSINETLLDHTGRLARLEAVIVEPAPAA